MGMRLRPGAQLKIGGYRSAAFVSPRPWAQIRRALEKKQTGPLAKFAGAPFVQRNRLHPRGGKGISKPINHVVSAVARNCANPVCICPEMRFRAGYATL